MFDERRGEAPALEDARVLSKFGPDGQVLAADHGEEGCAVARIAEMVDERAAEAILGIVDAVLHPRDDGERTLAVLVVDAADDDVAEALAMPEEILTRRRQDTPVVLGDDVIDHRQVRRVVKDNRLLAVVDVEVARDRVFAPDKAVAESLRRDVVQHLVVVLVATHHESNRVARIRLKLLAEIGVTDVVAKAELAVTDDRARDVLEVDRALSRIHPRAVKAYAEFEVGDGDERSPELERLRLDEARRLLAKTSLPIAEIAQACGYQSDDAFRNAFKAATKLTPLKYRNKT